jgi:hypothetical protein
MSSTIIIECAACRRRQEITTTAARSTPKRAFAENSRAFCDCGKREWKMLEGWRK